MLAIVPRLFASASMSIPVPELSITISRTSLPAFISILVFESSLAMPGSSTAMLELSAAVPGSFVAMPKLSAAMPGLFAIMPRLSTTVLRLSVPTSASVFVLGLSAFIPLSAFAPMLYKLFFLLFLYCFCQKYQCSISPQKDKN